MPELTTTAAPRSVQLATDARLALRIADAMHESGYDEHESAVASDRAWCMAASIAGADEIPSLAVRTAVVAVLRDRAGRKQ
jgi:hypothetical protein